MLIVDCRAASISLHEQWLRRQCPDFGKTFGSTFQNNPDIPAELRDTRVLFPFPSGPVSIAAGETKSITMEGVRFSPSTRSIEPPNLNPKVASRSCRAYLGRIHRARVSIAGSSHLHWAGFLVCCT